MPRDNKFRELEIRDGWLLATGYVLSNEARVAFREGVLIGKGGKVREGLQRGLIFVKNSKEGGLAYFVKDSRGVRWLTL